MNRKRHQKKKQFKKVLLSLAEIIRVQMLHQAHIDKKLQVIFYRANENIGKIGKSQ